LRRKVELDCAFKQEKSSRSVQQVARQSQQSRIFTIENHRLTCHCFELIEAFPALLKQVKRKFTSAAAIIAENDPKL